MIRPEESQQEILILDLTLVVRNIGIEDDTCRVVHPGS